MRRRALPSRVAAVAACVAALAAACGDAHGRTAASPARGTVRPVAWRLVESGAGGRSLAVAYVVRGCDGPARAAVVESAASIRIAVRARDESGPGVACPALIRCARLTVHLRARIAGRRVLGAGRVFAGCGRLTATRGGGALVTLVPRLLGLARADATGVLRADGLRAHTTGAGRRVVGQRPAPGRVARGAVALRLGS